MPLYEEKLINPLAVRFTQEHIRPIFQDGRELEVSIRQIKTKPGVGEYDIILEAPFEDIEVIRWHKRDESSEEADSRHWFTFDNRRLYCLQRAAMQLWPRRVGVVVQALYAATDGSHRKDNSLTAGRSVGIGHSMKLLTGRWDWRKAVSAPTGIDSQRALAAVAADDQRTCVEDLADAPAPPSMLDLFFAGKGLDGQVEEGPAKKGGPRSELSTMDPSTPRSLGASDDATPPQRGWEAVSEALCGTWLGDKGEKYSVQVDADGWRCVRTDDAGSSKAFTLWYDEHNDSVWWGTNYTMYMQASALLEQGGQIQWYKNTGTWKPSFAWTRSGAAAQPRRGQQKAASHGEAPAPAPVPAQGARGGRRGRRGGREAA